MNPILIGSLARQLLALSACTAAVQLVNEHPDELLPTDPPLPAPPTERRRSKKSAPEVIRLKDERVTPKPKSASLRRLLKHKGRK